MDQGKICVSIYGETADEVMDRVNSAEDVADLIEIRFDCLRPEEIRPLVERLETLSGQLLITFRPAEQGGKRELTITERLKFWELLLSRLKGTNFLVDYEFDLDFPLQLNRERAIVSMHDFEGAGNELRQQLDALSQLTEKTIKIAVSVNDAVDAIQVWNLLGQKSNDVIPIAMGEAGKWTRILGLAHGAPMTYASIGRGDETAPGQISAADLRDVFRVKELNKDTGVLGVIAGDTSYSLSPYMLNAAFKQAGLNLVFVPLQVGDLDAFIRRMVKSETREVELNFRGFSVTNPHKQSIMNHLDFIDETARKIGAVNTVKINDGKLYGYNTDATGFIAPLKKVYGDLNAARVSVAGAGGAARACVYALTQEGADVTLLARDPDKAVTFASEFDIEVSRLTTDQPLTTDIFVNATPLGTKGGRENETIATSNKLNGVKLVYDLVYNPGETRLLREAKMAGAKTLGGIEMLVAQGAEQFLIWTGKEGPLATMSTAIQERLK